MEEGKKFDQGKPRMSLLPYQPLLEVVKVLEFGAKKYGDWNWRGGMDWLRLADATLRHVFAWISGEDKDQESGISHLAHAACDLLFLLQYNMDFPERDDRYKKPTRFVAGENIRSGDLVVIKTRRKATCGDCDFHKYDADGNSLCPYGSENTLWDKTDDFCKDAGRINGKECPDGLIPTSDS